MGKVKMEGGNVGEEMREVVMMVVEMLKEAKFVLMAID